jgi:hypothetical protein
MKLLNIVHASPNGKAWVYAGDLGYVVYQDTWPDIQLRATYSYSYGFPDALDHAIAACDAIKPWFDGSAV